MLNLLTALTIIATLFASSASASPTPRTTAQWATLCRGAQRPDSLGTIPLLRTQTRALASSLKAAGYPSGWHQDLASVLVDHGDGTCGYDNRAFLQLSPKDPEADLDGNDVLDIEDPFPDGIRFTDPEAKIPTGFVWSAKFASAGAQLYLPPIAETPTKVAAERDKFIALAQTLCIDSGRAWNAIAKTCPGKTPPRISAVHAVPPPHQSVVAGTVSAKEKMLIAVAISLGWLLFAIMFYLWWNADHSERDNALLRTNAAEQLAVKLAGQRDEERTRAENITARYMEQTREQSEAHQQAMDRIIAQALADEHELNAEITRLREAAQASIVAHTAAMTEVATARDEDRATLTVLTDELTNTRSALRTANDELVSSRAALELESEEARVALAESDELLVGAEDHIRALEEGATTLRRERAEAQLDTQRAWEVAREQQKVLRMISRGGTSQLTKVSRVLEAMDVGLRGADYFLRVKCPRPGKGERAGKTPRDKAHAELMTMMTELRALLPPRSRNGDHATIPAQAQT